MARFKPVRAKKGKNAPAPQGGLPCVIVLISGIALIMLFLYYVMGHANGQ